MFGSRVRRTSIGHYPVPEVSCAVRGARYAEREAREYGSSRAFVATVSALALVVDSGVSRVIGNFYIGINRPPLPARLFMSFEDAAEWLASSPGR